jgi:hypothetical protein
MHVFKLKQINIITVQCIVQLKIVHLSTHSTDFLASNLHEMSHLVSSSIFHLKKKRLHAKRSYDKQLKVVLSRNWLF